MNNEDEEEKIESTKKPAINDPTHTF